jgi:hypothetical protein
MFPATVLTTPRASSTKRIRLKFLSAMNTPVALKTAAAGPML